MSILLLTLFACGRNAADVPVRMVGVGDDPEEIGPSPTAYGGVVEYDRVELAGGALTLGHMGLGSFNEVGPELVSFAPPYAGVIGFSYIFDTKLAAADSLAFTAPTPPSTEDTCYTVIYPEGPLGSFTTVDVGDFMQFETADGASRFRMARVPADYPPDPQDLFIYYSSVEEYAPHSRTHLVPGEDAGDPLGMTEEVWRYANYPLGQEMLYSFPGGFSRFDQPVGSIPVPSASLASPPSLQIPDALGSVLLEWDGPRYAWDGTVIDQGKQSTCLEFYDGRADRPTDVTACDTPSDLPTKSDEYASFKGQIYSGPWDAADGKLTLKWVPKEHGDQVSFSIRFMAPTDPNSFDFQVARLNDRPVATCDINDPGVTYEPDPTLFTKKDGEWTPNPQLMGDPMSKMVEVSCLMKDDGEFTVDSSMIAEAQEYAEEHGAQGAVMFVGRGTEVEADFPAVKDQYDNRHDISPVRISSRDVRVGRLHWGAATEGGAE
jgi:hypothetical protein